jgi:glutathione S-transferase
VLRLVTIPISHYCEKARWGLQRAGLPYREQAHVQGLHRLYARRAGGGATVPVLVTPEGAIGESEQILEWCDRGLDPERRLFGSDEPQRREILALARRFDAGLGPSGRRLIYVRMFAQRELLLRYNNQGVPAREARVIRHGLPLMSRFVGRALGIRPGVEVADEALVWGEFDYVAELLADGRPYLLGERFTAADLTFAALAAPVLMPAVYGCRLPAPEELDPATGTLVARARAHPAGAFALALSGARAHGTEALDSPNVEPRR